MFLFADFEGIEIHSRKAFNVPKEKTTQAKAVDKSIGPMVNKNNIFFLFRHFKVLGTGLSLNMLQYTCTCTCTINLIDQYTGSYML